MSLSIKSQRGAGHALILILIAVVAVSALAYIGLAKKLPGATTTSTPTAKITSKADVTTAKDDLNNVSVDKDLDASALSSDVKDLQ